jgi:YD repeat-containing protein
MNRKTAHLLGSAVGILAIHGHAAASDTVTYTYDALGRLVAVSTSGGPNNGQTVSTAYDPAGNRASYCLATAGTPACPPPGSPPPPSPPPGNQPPVAVNDAGGMSRCVAASFAVLANDSDPDGNTPLALVSVSGGGTRGTPSISGTSILFTPNGINGTANVSYTMRDSLGATATASLTITITNGSCGPPQ